jgi:hypothetical protein
VREKQVKERSEDVYKGENTMSESNGKEKNLKK